MCPMCRTDYCFSVACINTPEADATYAPSFASETGDEIEATCSSCFQEGCFTNLATRDDAALELGRELENDIAKVLDDCEAPVNAVEVLEEGIVASVEEPAMDYETDGDALHQDPLETLSNDDSAGEEEEAQSASEGHSPSEEEEVKVQEPPRKKKKRRRPNHYIFTCTGPKDKRCTPRLKHSKLRVSVTNILSAIDHNNMYHSGNISFMGGGIGLNGGQRYVCCTGTCGTNREAPTLFEEITSIPGQIAVLNHLYNEHEIDNIHLTTRMKKNVEVAPLVHNPAAVKPRDYYYEYPRGAKGSTSLLIVV